MNPQLQDGGQDHHEPEQHEQPEHQEGAPAERGPLPNLHVSTTNIPIADIIVGERHRKDFGDLQALADSILKLGLLQPVGVTWDRHLVVGERRLRACRDILGFQNIDIRIVDVPTILAGEYAENEVREDFSPSERVAIAEALRQQLAGRHGGDRRSDDFHRSRDEPQGGGTDEGGPSSTLPAGKTRDLVAARAGFDSGRQLDRASNVVKFGVPKLVEAMDTGKVSISAAAEIARAAPEEQAAIVDLPEPARIEEMRRRKEEAARLRAAADEQEASTGPTAYTGFLKKNGRLPSPTEAKTIADLDHRETPAEGGGRVKPGKPTTKEERARKKELEGYSNELWNLRQALHHLLEVKSDPATLIAHMHDVDRNAVRERLAEGRAMLNRFGKEWKNHER